MTLPTPHPRPRSGARRLAVFAALSLALVLAPIGPGDAGASVPETVSARLDRLPAAGAKAADASLPPGLATAAVSAPASAPIPFSMVGLEVPEGASAHVRTSADGRTWTGWVPAATYEDDSGPDAGTPEERAARDHTRFTEPVWAGEARWVQVAVEGAAPSEVAATFIDSKGLGEGRLLRAAGTARAALSPDAAGASTARPTIVSRAGWGANESIRRSTGSAASRARFGVLHHTAGGNGYTAADGPAVVRGIYHYHVRTLGWSDIGYNLLVDRYGRIYEGRHGGVERAVVGSHAQGFNTGSIGIAILGNFEGQAAPPAALAAVADVLAWKYALHGIDPGATVTVTSGGSNKYASGTSVRLATLIGHRDVGLTACPGARLYPQLPALRSAVAARMGAAPAPPPPPPPPPTPPPPAPAPGGTSAGSPPAFSDVTGNVHGFAIQRLADSRVTSGCGGDRFCPDAPVTRGQTVTFLGRALGLAPAGGQRFADVPPGHVHAGYIAAAVDAKIISGHPDGTFLPDEPLSRDQMATILRKAAKLDHVWGSRFSDVPFESVHRPSINAIADARITSGCTRDRYCPGDDVTRAQMATFLVRAVLR
jgi:hypothetical protein